MPRVSRTVLLVCLLTGLAGCDGAGAPPVIVHGRVRYHGAEVAHARLAFVPDENRGAHGDILRTETADDGTFVLHTDDPTGIPPGWYRITVMALEAPVSGDARAVPQSLLPDRYRDPELSQLSCEILAGQDNTVDLDLQ